MWIAGHVLARFVLPVLLAFLAGSLVHWTALQSSTAGLSLVLFADWAASLGQVRLRFDVLDRAWRRWTAMALLAVMLVMAFVFGRADLGFLPSIPGPSGRTHFRIISFIVVLLPAVPFAIRTVVDTILGRDR